MNLNRVFKAATAALELAENGMAARDAVANIRDHFELTDEEALHVEARVQAKLERTK